MSEEQNPQEVKAEVEEPTDTSEYMDATEERGNEAGSHNEASMETTEKDVEDKSGIIKEESNDGDLEDSQTSAEDESSDDDDDEEEEEEERVQFTEPLATTRSRRANAGNRMSTLLLEEEDEFYATHYGGFMEEDDDDDFDEEEEADKVEVAEDYDVDSDFDIDETDEIAPEHQNIEEERRTRKSAYREPKRKIHQTTSTAGVNKTSTPMQSKSQQRPVDSTFTTPQSPGKHRPERSFRDSTKKKTAETIKNIESVKKRKKNRNIEPHRRLTQEEMLEEAKITEADNLKSLEIYRRLEAENLKKIKLIKRSIPAPYITYYSSVFTNPETKERYSRNLCTYVGCEPGTKNGVPTVT